MVPFPPESPASGIGDLGFHRVLWYRRTVKAVDIDSTDHRPGRRLLLHFGAVDYRADIWISGMHVASHEGGHTPFTVEVPDGQAGFDIVVRVEDDPQDLAQPRGKQDWEEKRHVVWYDRTSGIWQPVWLESVPRQHIAHLSWRANVAGASATLSIELAERPKSETRLQLNLSVGDTALADHSVRLTEPRTDVVVPISVLRNGQSLSDYLWSPESPTLVDAVLELSVVGDDPDAVGSYFGIRDVGTEGGSFLLNDRPYDVRAVLAQGYWAESHLAAPGPEALRAEVELIKSLGFTTVRMHQKIEDPRFLYWADRLGLLVWEEMPSTYEFSTTSSARIVAEWTEVVRRDSSHPSVVVWVPFNESWGVQHVATEVPQQDLVRALYHLTKALDPTRLVVSNDGWEHTRSDLLTIHDYENEAARLLASYQDRDAVQRSIDGIASNGRRLLIGTHDERAHTAAAPVVLSEFGGVSIDPPGRDGWGYRLVESHYHLEEHLVGLFAAAHESHGLAGWCYTQLTDTAQETNGLADAQRIPKLPAERIRAIVEGVGFSPPSDEPTYSESNRTHDAAASMPARDG
ncbi:glycoside hydrolase family 2 TIM barrel-domain containing protein [Microcella indica]|uniref:glycoside hydrolase family 2 TIM barrel-domain containing protein n=1 Tax=Microcella indica TaxID=2750620 RepID=UPI001FE40A55|nr:glycoside hydrolase family 2 TIM barrel-domain containing protein [Microcella indica]